MTMEEMDKQVLGIGVAGHIFQKSNQLPHPTVAIDARLSLNAQYMGIALPFVEAERDTEKFLV